MRAVLFVCLLAACDYRSFDDCAVSCTAATGCPDGFACGAEGFCRPEGASSSCRDVLSDAGRKDACAGRQCDVVDCAGQSRPPTSVSGTVFAPNGTLPLNGVTVYVPNSDPGPLGDGVRCDRCEDRLPGEPIVRAFSDETGHFTLKDVPAGTDVPLVITTGKWRRQIVIPTVAECTDTALPASQTSLPKNRAQGDLPRIAVTTGSADALECVVRRLGVADTEFETDGDPGRVHLYAGNGTSALADNTAMAGAGTLWNDLDHLKQYDIALFSCESAPNPTTKPQTAMNNVKMYADLGGRLVLTHSQNIWIDGEIGVPSHAPAVWPQIASFPTEVTATAGSLVIDQTKPRGTAFAGWMSHVMGSTTAGQFAVTNRRQTVASIDDTKARRWAFFQSTTELPSMFQFTTPNEAAADARCGKVVFADMHAANGSTSMAGTLFPSGCSTAALTPEEKAFAFVLFDASACIGAGE
jgi:hypothetical protein